VKPPAGAGDGSTASVPAGGAGAAVGVAAGGAPSAITLPWSSVEKPPTVDVSGVPIAAAVYAGGGGAAEA
jgi:hypothetical protein